MDAYAVFLQAHKPKFMISGLVTFTGRGTHCEHSEKGLGNHEKGLVPVS
jgi:hypothetical protein